MAGKRHFFETRKQPLISRSAFALRMGKYFVAAASIILASLLTGMIGYHLIEGMSWIDAFLNAAMILSGMGPVGSLVSWGGKLFAGIYALYSGLVLILTSGLLLAPMLHRLLHCFHLDADEEQAK